MSKPRFLLDEHVNRAAQRQLRRLDLRIEVLAVGDPGGPPSGAPDPEVLAWIEQNGHILVTENRRTMPGFLSAHFSAGRHVPGILWLRPGAQLGTVIENLYEIRTLDEAFELRSNRAFSHRRRAMSHQS